MKKIKEKLILAGSPECIQHQTPFLVFLKRLFSVAWWIWLIITIPLFLHALFKEDTSRIVSTFYFCIADIFLVLCNAIWSKNMLRCPFCHHFFCTKRISDNQVVHESTVNTSKKVYNNHSGFTVDNRGNIGMYMGTTSKKVYGKAVAETQMHNVKCSCCGAVSTVKQYDFYKRF